MLSSQLLIQLQLRFKVPEFKEILEICQIREFEYFFLSFFNRVYLIRDSILYLREPIKYLGKISCEIFHKTKRNQLQLIKIKLGS